MVGIEAVLRRLEEPKAWDNESEFRTDLVKLLRMRGWRVSFHAPARPGRRGGRAYMTMGSPGFPDLTCLRPPNLVFLELKYLGKSADPEQRLWLNGIAECGGNVRAWCVDPGHWALLVDLARDGIAGVENDSAANEGEGDNDDA